MQITTSLFVTAALVLGACDGTIIDDESPSDDDQHASPDNDATPSAGAPMITRQMSESSAVIANPERGYYVGYDLLTPDRAARVRSGGHTLAISLVRLDDYRDRALDGALLTALDRGFAAARAAGIKVILRFTYNSSFAADASRARIVGHLGQLAPVLDRNADVIAVMQAGFIGAWGEWHTSTNGLDNDADRAAVLAAILDALPPSRGVQVRTPMFKDAALPGGPLRVAEAYNGTARARVGHHNDCFLASASDLGTYASPVSAWEAYVAGDGRFTAIGGETCAVHAPRTDCVSAMTAMATNHWSYLNREYNQTVLSTWATQGCAVETEQRLGYRLALTRLAHSAAVAPGGVLEVQLDISNRGFASLYNRRPVEIVLSDGVTRRAVRLTEVDARRWAPGAQQTLTVRLRIPADASPGGYTLGLRLPDDAVALADDARYAIQLANDDVWDGETGDNRVSEALTIDPGAPGPRDPSAMDLIELP